MHTNQKIIFIFKTLLILLTLSSCTSEPAIKIEAKKISQGWWDASVAVCNKKNYTKIMRNRLVLGGYFDIIDTPLIEFKNTNFLLLEEKISEVDKLNGIEWQGYAAFPAKITYRYFESTSQKWSSWRESAIIYEPDKFLQGIYEMSGEKYINSPMVQKLIKKNGKWDYDSGTKNPVLVKPNCSEIPAE